MGRVRVPSSRALEAAEAARLESQARAAKHQTTTTTSATTKPTPKLKAATSKSADAPKTKGKGKGKVKEETAIDEGAEEEEDAQSSVTTGQTNANFDNSPDMTLCKY